MVAIRAKADIEGLDPEMVAAQAHVEVRAEPVASFPAQLVNVHH
jgi:hypothetical protein